MLLVSFKRDGGVIEGDYVLPVDAPRDPADVRPDEIYAACDNFYRYNEEIVDPVQAEHVPLPTPFTAEALAALEADPRDTIRLLLVNGLGTGYGDLLIGSVALERLHTKLRGWGKALVVDMLIREGRWHKYCEVFKLNPYVRRVYPAILPLPDLIRYDYALSLEHMLLDPAFHNENFFDFFLGRFFLDPAAEPKALTLYPNPRILAETADIAKEARQHYPDDPILVLNFFATTLRSVPRARWKDFIDAFADRYVIALIGAHTNERLVADFQRLLPKKTRKRVLDLAAVSCRSFDHLTGLLHHLADAVVTVDTSVLHVCGGLNVPCVGIFPTIEPDLRIRYYPTVTAYCPPHFRASPYWGESKLSLEENKGLHATPAFVDLWKRVDTGAIRRLVDAQVAQPRPAPGLPERVYVNTSAPPRTLVYTGTANPTPADRLRYHLLALALPPSCAVDWAVAQPFEFRSMAPYDLVVLGAGEVLDAAAVKQTRFLDLLHAAKRRVGVFGFGAAGAVPSTVSGPVLDRLDLWFARTRADVERHGEGRETASWLGAWLLALVPPGHWALDDELSVDETTYGDGALDGLLREVQRFRRVRASGLATLAGALLAADEITWHERPDRRGTAPMGTLLADVFDRVPSEGKAFVVDRATVQAYRGQVIENIETMRRRLTALLG